MQVRNAKDKTQKEKEKEKSSALEKRSRELDKIDNEWPAKINKNGYRKLRGFSDKEIRKINAYREKKEKNRVKKNKESMFTRLYDSIRTTLAPEKVEEEKEEKKQNASEHRNAMRKKYRIP